MAGPDPTQHTRARRGDLAIIERLHVSHATTGRTETTEYAVVIVSNITRDGHVKAVRDVRWGDDAYPQPLDRIVGFRRIYLVSKTGIDVAAAIATARAHTYPDSTTPLAYDSLDDVRAALAPHRIRSSK